MNTFIYITQKSTGLLLLCLPFIKGDLYFMASPSCCGFPSHIISKDEQVYICVICKQVYYNVSSGDTDALYYWAGIKRKGPLFYGY